MLLKRRASYALVLGSCVIWAGSAANAQVRPFRPEDLFRIEALGPIVISSDGAHVAYVRMRPKGMVKDYSQDPLGESPRGDIWVVEPGGTPRNLTHGDADSSGWFAPQWSPDGRRLLFASTRGGLVTLWTWRPGAVAPQELVRRSVDPTGTAWVAGGSVVTVARGNGAAWWPLTWEAQAAQAAMRAWPVAWAGRTATASVVRSPAPTSVESRVQDSLVVVDTHGSLRTLASGFEVRSVRPSPDGRFVAFLRAKRVVRPDALRPLLHWFSSTGAFDEELAIVDVATGGLLVAPTTVADADPNTVTWSADSRRVAVIASGGGVRIDQASLVACAAPTTPPVTVLSCDTLADKLPAADPRYPLEPLRLVWAGDAVIVGRDQRLKRPAQRRYELYAVVSKEAPRLLVGGLGSSPTDLLLERRRLGIRAALVGVLDGRLVRLHLDGSLDTLHVAGGRRVLKIVAADTAGGLGAARLVIEAASDSGSRVATYLVDLVGDTAMRLPSAPVEGAALAAASLRGGTVVYTATTDTGTFAWITSNVASTAPPAGAKPVVALNSFLRDITPGTFQSFGYRTATGESVTGWILLPPGHRSGMRHPAVVWVYPGGFYDSQMPSQARVSDDFWLNQQLYAAHGYAVVFPTMPFDNAPPYTQLLGGILPAVDAVVGLGLIDSARVAIAGHSFGGYTALSVVTQTDRFKAAIALAGPTELISSYGTFYSSLRYTETPQEYWWAPNIWETGGNGYGGGIGVPPWKAPDVYLRNSPVIYADRVHTPVLQIHGDLDQVPMDQAEQFFSALYRQNKPAEFVRYWGESHAIRSRANVLDLWQRQYEWLDQYLGGDHTSRIK